jgi:AcrR family transcriptional regulator
MPRSKRRLDPERAEERARRRAGLLDAAADVIRRDGPQASMDALAAEAGVTKPILYRHFGDRSGLIKALAERFADELIDHLTEALERPGTPQETIAATIDAFVGFIEEEPQIYAFLTHQAFPDDPDEIVGIMRRVAQRVAVVLGEGLRQAGLDSGAAEPWAHGIVGMVHLAGHWWVGHRTMPRARLVEYLTTLLWSGLSGVGVPANLDLPVRLDERRRTSS